ncbi:CP-type G domain-containing protein [Haematococcus lacustris]|uniref:CP-type G domain-containing protein n=1 Tax=Haematococcus lacustris TaxID=44745 RepID=A0A699Z5C3_HAELA|nr:CP-type G domain-containing protein [Haematococcus lacustris]
MVGLVGYPNVGKSSTINALFGAKKTAVAPTPGKTKHFQTLIVSPTMALCDCPGLVMPKFARSKADMVVAGVIPIDRLTEMRSPIEIMSQRVGRAQERAEGLYDGAAMTTGKKGGLVRMPVYAGAP